MAVGHQKISRVLRLATVLLFFLALPLQAIFKHGPPWKVTSPAPWLVPFLSSFALAASSADASERFDSCPNRIYTGQDRDVVLNRRVSVREVRRASEETQPLLKRAQPLTHAHVLRFEAASLGVIHEPF